MESKIRVESKMSQIQTYMDSNRLKLIPENTKLMILTTKNKNMHKDLKVEFNGVEIEQVQFTKFLGIMISGNLKWKSISSNQRTLFSSTATRD